MSEFDIWITPTSPTAGIRHQKTGTAQTHNERVVPYADFLGHYLTSTALMHHRILTTPIGENDQKLSIGIQLQGKPGGDWQLLADTALFNKHYWQNESCED